jgi:hypothetical protein
LRRWSDGAWRQWYAAVWAETAVLADRPGCAYQQARTLVLAGGDSRREGEEMMTAIGAAPMTL